VSRLYAAENSNHEIAIAYVSLFLLMTIRPYDEVSKDPNASPLERETALLVEWNKTLREVALIRNALERLDGMYRSERADPPPRPQWLRDALAKDRSRCRT
jgi:hypothetical protein